MTCDASFIAYSLIYRMAIDIVTTLTSALVEDEGLEISDDFFRDSELFKDTDIPVHLIGDAKSPRILMHAISEAEDIGRAI